MEKRALKDEEKKTEGEEALISPNKRVLLRECEEKASLLLLLLLISLSALCLTVTFRNLNFENLQISLQPEKESPEKQFRMKPGNTSRSIRAEILQLKDEVKLQETVFCLCLDN